MAIKLLNTQTGNYTRPAKIDDIEFILSCCLDWPNGRWSYKMAESYVKNSISNNMGNPLDGSEPINKLCVIFCNSSNERMGFVVFSFYKQPEGIPSSSQAFAAAMHKDYRGKGFYNEFVRLIEWQGETTDREELHIEAIHNSTSEAIKHKAEKLGYNLIIDQGTTFTLDITIKEDDVVKDLTGYSARAQMRATKTASSVAASFTCTIPTPANGTVRMALSPSTSSSMTAGQFFYDLEIYTSSDAIVKRIVEGTVTLTQEVTR
jgi:hypothetical protein